MASRDLRNETAALLDRMAAGEPMTITVEGRPVTVQRPLGRRPQWIGCDEFVERILTHQADAAMTAELAELAPDDPVSG